MKKKKKASEPLTMVSVRGHSPETDDVSGPSPSYRCEAEWMFGNTGPVLTFGIINAALAPSKTVPQQSVR